MLLAAGAPAACGSAGRPSTEDGIPKLLLEEVRPIGSGPRFRPPVTGPPHGICRRALGRRFGVHIELFAANRVVIVPAGIGTRPPRSISPGGMLSARCYAALVTLQPTGVVLVRRGSRLTLASVFRSWGQPLSDTRLAGFSASRGALVAVFVGGRRWDRAPGDVPLVSGSEIVLEVGPHVPPHTSFTFPPLP